jgi:hypothetical protein
MLKQNESKTTIQPISALPAGVPCRFYAIDSVDAFLAANPEIETAYYNAKTKTLFVPLYQARVEVVYAADEG